MGKGTKMLTSQVTLRDIASRTGYSVTTVSKALRNHPDIPAKTQQSIIQTAKDMGYVVNTMASALRSGYTRSLALIVSDISNPLFGIICKEIESYAAKHEYSIIIYNTDEQENNELKAIENAISKSVDGILLTPCQTSNASLELLAQYKKPCVLIGRYFDDYPMDAILFDDENGGYLAGKHLIEQGFKNIIMLNAPGNSSARDRSRGFQQAIQEDSSVKGHVIEATSALCGVNDVALNECIDTHFDALFAYSDLIALEAVSILKKQGRYSHNIGIIGYDDIVSDFTIPFSLSSISFSKKELGIELIDLLLKRIQGDYSDFPCQKNVTANLVIRDSTIPISSSQIYP